MPTFHVTAPDGHVLEITGPEGSTQEQAIEQAKKQYSPKTENKVEAPGFLEKTISNIPSSLGNVLAHPAGSAPMGAPGAKENYARGEYPEQFSDVLPKIQKFMQHPWDNTVDAVKGAISEHPVETALGVAAGGRQLMPNLASKVDAFAASAPRNVYNEVKTAAPDIYKRGKYGALAGGIGGEAFGGRWGEGAGVGGVIGAAPPLFGAVKRGIQKSLGPDLDARLRNFSAPGGGNEPMPEPTYTDAPLGGYRTEAPVKPPNSSMELPDWMKEPDIQEILQERTRSFQRPVESPQVTQARSNFQKIKGSPSPLKVEPPKNYKSTPDPIEYTSKKDLKVSSPVDDEKLARQRAAEEFRNAPREWPNEMPVAAPETAAVKPVEQPATLQHETPVAPPEAPKAQQTAPETAQKKPTSEGEKPSETPKDETIEDPNKQYSWNDIKDKYGSERVKTTKAKLQDLSDRIKETKNMTLKDFLDLPQEMQDAIVQAPRHPNHPNRPKYSSGFHRGYSDLLKELHGSD